MEEESSGVVERPVLFEGSSTSAKGEVFLFGKVYSKNLLLALVVVCLAVLALTAFLFFQFQQPKEIERIEGQRVVFAAGEKFDFVIVTNYAALSKKYGSSYSSLVLQRIDMLSKIVKESEGLKSGVVLLDEEAHASKYKFVKVGGEFERDFARESLEQAIIATNASFVLIVGNDDVVPFRMVKNPLFNSEDGEFDFIVEVDGEVYSDQFRSVAIGRLVDGNTDGSNLTGMLENAIALHKTQGAQVEFAKVVSNDSYGGFLRVVPVQVANQSEPTVSPPVAVFNFFNLAFDPFAAEQIFKEIQNSKTKLVFIALHGNEPAQEQAFTGRLPFEEGDFLAMNAPIARQGFNYAGKLFVVDSCYGASPNRKSSQSLPVAFIERGAAGFIGSTTTALSNRRLFKLNQAKESDFLEAGAASSITFFALKEAASGKRLGEALQLAKKKLDLQKPVNQLTYYQFVLYGDPTLKLK